MTSMQEDLRVVFESRNRQSCSDRSLVLAAAGIPHQMIDDGLTAALVVPAEISARAVEELRLYDEENPRVVAKVKKRVAYQDALPGVSGYFLVVCAVAWLAGYSIFGHDWFDAGRIDGALIRNGEWWRTITALTLHADAKHLVGNLVFGVLFGIFAGRLLGSGIAWLAIVVAAAMGNAANTLLLESAHRSIGASTAVFAALGLVVLGTLIPPAEPLWRRLHGIVGDVGLVFFEEDGTGVVALTPDPGEWRLSINGKGNSWLPYGRGHTVLGALPASIHPTPRRVAIVGLGSGDTVWAASYRPVTTSTTVFEISRPLPRVLWRLAGFVDMPDMRRLLEDPRLTIRLEDGRKALEAEPHLYDLLEADATWPETAGSGNLYSLEFFQAASRRLAEGGVMCTWAPTRRTYRTFREVFPHVVEDESGGILIGSLDPIPFEPEAWVARAVAGEPYLGAERVGEVVEALRGLRPAERSTEGTLNTDLFPRDELAVR